MTLQRHNATKKIETHQRATVYFAPEIHEAPRLRAAETGSSISQLVNAAVKEALSDDAADLDAFLLQADEKNVSLGDSRPRAVEGFPGYADRYRLRHRNYRIVYHVDDGRNEVTVVSIGYRER